jgi:hypothetical protein
MQLQCAASTFKSYMEIHPKHAECRISLPWIGFWDGAQQARKQRQLTSSVCGLLLANSILPMAKAMLLTRKEVAVAELHATSKFTVSSQKSSVPLLSSSS